MRSCPLQRSLGRIKYGLHFLNRHWLDNLNPLIPAIGYTAVGIRSKTIEIKCNIKNATLRISLKKLRHWIVIIYMNTPSKS